MTNLCIIPARGGSKRIPKKNIKNFLGKPIIAYSIDAALKSGLFDEVMVSTDDEEIAEIAKKYGAKVPFLRSKKNADDHAVLADVIFEVVTTYLNKNIVIKNVCCILPTAPFITGTKLQKSFLLFNNKEYDSLIPIVEFSYPIQRSLIVNKNQKISFSNPEHEKTRSQDLEKNYHDVGQFYWVKQHVAIEKKTLITTNTGYFQLSGMEVQDIDTEEDWRIAEIKYQILNE